MADNSAIFEAFFARNTPQECIDPSFPAIYIKTNANCNAWLHIIYTDSRVENLRLFIDSEDPSKENSIYPFYTFESDFYDTPLWTHSLFIKPLSFWKSHVFALNINHQNKTIMYFGGIEWGFKLSFLRIKPLAIDPKLLDPNDWNIAWQFVKEKLPDYNLIDYIENK